MDMSTQLNVTVQDGLVSKMKMDALKSGKSLKVLAAAILSDFFLRLTWNEREAFYANLPSKPSGRKLTMPKPLKKAA